MMNGKTIKKIRAGLGLTQVEFAKELEVNVATLVRWECDVVTPSGPTKLYLLHLQEQLEDA